MKRAFGHFKMVFRILSGGERCLKTNIDRVPMYVLSCITMHNFLKELGYVVDEDEARGYQDHEDGEEVARPADLAGPVQADGRECRDKLRRLWLADADE